MQVKNCVLGKGMHTIAFAIDDNYNDAVVTFYRDGKVYNTHYCTTEDAEYYYENLIKNQYVEI